jgi:hypothetical protein
VGSNAGLRLDQGRRMRHRTTTCGVMISVQSARSPGMAVVHGSARRVGSPGIRIISGPGHGSWRHASMEPGSHGCAILGRRTLLAIALPALYCKVHFSLLTLTSILNLHAQCTSEVHENLQSRSWACPRHSCQGHTAQETGLAVFVKVKSIFENSGDKFTVHKVFFVLA